jgi:chromosomal replication initiation ATPase DnaA
MSKSVFQSMSDDELWRIFKDVAETLAERMTTEKQELKSRLARLDSLTAIKNTDEIAKRRPYTH